MRRYRVGFSRVASAQVETIESWWWENRPAAREMFRREIEAAVRFLETSPLIGKSYAEAPVPGVRRMLIGRSRYQVYGRCLVQRGYHPGGVVRRTRQWPTPLATATQPAGGRNLTAELIFSVNRLALTGPRRT
jgi:plasmid stabilization system protein ParE